MSSNKNIKILLYGNIYRDYRSQTLIKLLLDLKYHVSLVCPDFFCAGRPKSRFEKGLLLFSLIELFLKAAFADIIYLPPMNTRYIKSAALAAKVFRKKLVTEMYISIYDTYVNDQKPLNGKRVEPGSKKAKDMLAKDIIALTKSDYIIHTTSHELDYWEKLFNVQRDRSRVFIAPNCNVSSLVSERKFLQDEILKICWWGTFIPLHGLDNILEALKLLQKQGMPFNCTLFGVDNSLFIKYQKKIQQEQLQEQVLLRKDLNFSDGSLPKHLVSQCDLALGIFGNTDKALNTVPNKLIEALSMAIPTLTMSSPALTEFFSPKDLWTCSPTPESIAHSITKIAKRAADPVDWQQTRQKVLDTFSVTRYQQVVNEVIETSVLEETSSKKLQPKADAVA